MSLPIPNFLIIGAQKSGTTSLHQYLKAHPSIFMSTPIKEPAFFFDETIIPDFWRRRGRAVASRDDLLSRHMLKGYKGEAQFGESSTHYTLGDLSRTQGIPQRIAQMSPDMKFVYILRDPIDRIRSNYLHSMRLGLRPVKGTFEQYLDGKRGGVAVRTSLYFEQLSEYLSIFPADRFHVVIFEEFVKSPAAHMAGICRFLGVDAMPRRVKYDAHNVSHNRGQATASNHLDCSSGRLAELKLRVGADTRKLCDWLGRSEISDWDLTV